MLRFWSSGAAALLAGTTLFAAEVQVQVKPTPTPSPSRAAGSPSGSAAPSRPAGTPSASVAASRPPGTPSGTPAAAQLPQYRPALLGVGPTSVINRIDTAGLIRDGQKDAQLLF